MKKPLVAATIVCDTPLVQRLWRCYEMSDPQRLRNLPKRSASVVSNGTLAQSGSGPAPAPQPGLQKPTPHPALQRRGQQPAPATPERATTERLAPAKCWGPRPKTLCRLSEPWNNQFAAGVCGCSIEYPPWLGSCKAARAGGVSLRFFFGNRWIAPRRLMTAAPPSTRSRGCSAMRIPIPRMSCISAEGRHA